MHLRITTEIPDDWEKTGLRYLTHRVDGLEWDFTDEKVAVIRVKSRIAPLYWHGE